MSACRLSSWRMSRMASEVFCPRRICCCEAVARSGRGRGGGGGGGRGTRAAGAADTCYLIIASSWSLCSFYYWDLMCMSFIIQVDFDSGF